MEEKRFICSEALSGVRIDKAVSEAFPEISRSYAAKLIEEKNVLIGGKAAKASAKLSEGDEVSLLLPEPKTLQICAEDIKLDIVYEDESLLVINKPVDMVVHPSAGHESGTLVNALMAHCGDALSTINGVVRPGIVHRIDRDTTGLLVVAKGDRAHENLSAQLKARTLKRRYFAIVHNNITEDKGTVDAPIARSISDRKKMAVVKGGREAVTHFEVLERFGRYTYIACDLDTGRTHQIRVHMKYIGHPLLGDKTYGVKKEEFNLPGQMLHAGRIGFIHPKTQEYMEFTAPLPEIFEKTLANIRKTPQY